jgi:hypothetical protein
MLAAGEQKKMRSAGEGERHNRRYSSAHALGGLLHTGGLSEQEIVNTLSCNFGANKDSAMQTIVDGIASGREYPRDIPAPRDTNTQIAGYPSDTVDDLESLDPAELRRRLRETIAERDHWRGVAEHADSWRDWALKVAASNGDALPSGEGGCDQPLARDEVTRKPRRRRAEAHLYSGVQG